MNKWDVVISKSIEDPLFGIVAMPILHPTSSQMTGGLSSQENIEGLP